MSRVRNMAEQLLSDSQAKPQETPDGIDVAKLMSVVSKLKQSGNTEREKLLLALRPHLKDERRQRLDTAVKILKLIELAPLLKDSGILNF